MKAGFRQPHKHGFNSVQKQEQQISAADLNASSGFVNSVYSGLVCLGWQWVGTLGLTWSNSINFYFRNTQV